MQEVIENKLVTILINLKNIGLLLPLLKLIMTMTKLGFFTRKVKRKCEKIMEKEMVIIKVSQVAMLSGRMINILT